MRIEPAVPVGWGEASEPELDLVLTLARLSRVMVLASTEILPPLPDPLVWAVATAPLSKLMEEPLRSIPPPLPLPLVSAVMNPWPKMNRFVADVPSLIVPP